MKLIEKSKETISWYMKKVRDCNPAMYSGAAAFFVFLSFIPTVMLLVSIIPFVKIDTVYLLDMVKDVIPSSFYSFIEPIIEEVQKSSLGLISISAVVVLWTSGKGFWALMSGLNASRGIQSKSNFLMLRLWGSIYTLFFLLIIIVTLLGMVFGSVIMRGIVGYVSAFDYVYKFIIDCRFVFFFLILIICFQLIYTFIPKGKVKFRHQLPGAVFASLAWMIMSWAFSEYLENYAGVSIYGSLTTLIFLLIWLYYCMYIIIIGDIINQFLEPTYLRHDEYKRLRKQMKENSEI